MRDPHMWWKDDEWIRNIYIWYLLISLKGNFSQLPESLHAKQGQKLPLTERVPDTRFLYIYWCVEINARYETDADIEYYKQSSSEMHAEIGDSATLETFILCGPRWLYWNERGVVMHGRIVHYHQCSIYKNCYRHKIIKSTGTYPRNKPWDPTRALRNRALDRND